MQAKIRRIHRFALSLLFVTVCARTVEADLESFFRRLKVTPPQTPHPAIVQVQVQEGEAWAKGSGTLIAANEKFGWVLTNWHVVRGGNGTALISFPGGAQLQGQVVKMDHVWDLALVITGRPPVQPIPLSSTVPMIGEPLTIAGYGPGEFRAVQGRCTNYAAPDAQHPQEMIDVSVAARQGDSGGPILNERGELAGVLFGAGQGATTGTHVGRLRMFLLSSEPSTEQIAAGQGHQLITPRQVASARVESMPAPATPASVSLPPVTAQSAVHAAPNLTSEEPVHQRSVGTAENSVEAGIEVDPAATYVATQTNTSAMAADPFARIEMDASREPSSPAAPKDASAELPADASAVAIGQPEFQQEALPPASAEAPANAKSQPPAPQVANSGSNQLECDPATGVCRLVPREAMAKSAVAGTENPIAAQSANSKAPSLNASISNSLAEPTLPPAKRRKLDDTSMFLLFVGAVGAFVYFAPRQTGSPKRPKVTGKKAKTKRPKAVVVEDDEEDADEDDE